MRRSTSQSSGGSSRGGSSAGGNGEGGRVRRRPFSSSSSSLSSPFSSSSSFTASLSFSSSSPSLRSNLNNSNVLTLGLDVVTLRSVLCQWVPHYSSHNSEILSMLEGLFVELDDDAAAAELHQLVSVVGAGNDSNNSNNSSSNNCRAEQLLGNVVTVLTCFLDTCTQDVPTLVIFHAHSLIGQIRDLVLRQPEGALKAYLKALWLASWSHDIPAPCAARTLHRIGTLHGSDMQGRFKESRDVLRQALVMYAQAGVSGDHPAVVDCQNTFRRVDTRYWATVGANEDSWSSLAGVSDRRVPLPRINEEDSPDSIELRPRSGYLLQPRHHHHHHHHHHPDPHHPRDAPA